jgi:DNA-binding MarR family transcriptional regulator
MRNQQPAAPDTLTKITREEVVFLELSRTHDILSRPFASLMKDVDLSPAQFNVLRILRGAPEGLPCGEIGSRMITRDPDITRLLDRLDTLPRNERSQNGHDYDYRPGTEGAAATG